MKETFLINRKDGKIAILTDTTLIGNFLMGGYEYMTESEKEQLLQHQNNIKLSKISWQHSK